MRYPGCPKIVVEGRPDITSIGDLRRYLPRDAVIMSSVGLTMSEAMDHGCLCGVDIAKTLELVGVKAENNDGSWEIVEDYNSAPWSELGREDDNTAPTPHKNRCAGCTLEGKDECDVAWAIERGYSCYRAKDDAEGKTIQEFYADKGAVMDFNKKRKDERSCDDCGTKTVCDEHGPQCLSGEGFKPKAQEQGGDDFHKMSFNSDMQNKILIDSLREKLREATERIDGISEISASLEFERDDLRARLDDEKKRRVYYQGIVYDVMNSMSNGKMVCGTVDEPSTQVQDGVRLVLKHRNEFEQEAMNLRARLAEADKKWKAYEEQYILPCFKFSEEMGINLKELVSANPGKNCVELLVDDLRAKLHQIDDLLVNDFITVKDGDYKTALMEWLKRNIEMRSDSAISKEAKEKKETDDAMKKELADLRAEKESGKFWADIFNDPDDPEYNDKPLRDKVAAELHDYNMIIEGLPRIFCAVTGDMISKPNTDPDAVIAQFHEHVENLLRDAEKDWREDLALESGSDSDIEMLNEIGGAIAEVGESCGKNWGDIVDLLTRVKERMSALILATTSQSGHACANCGTKCTNQGCHDILCCKDWTNGIGTDPAEYWVCGDALNCDLNSQCQRQCPHEHEANGDCVEISPADCYDPPECVRCDKDGKLL